MNGVKDWLVIKDIYGAELVVSRHATDECGVSTWNIGVDDGDYVTALLTNNGIRQLYDFLGAVLMDCEVKQ